MIATLRRRFIARLALLGVLAAALLPTVSQALAAASAPGTWVEICTAQGMRLVAVDADAAGGTTAPAGDAAQHERCPYCVKAGGPLGMPPAPPDMPALTLGRSERPTLALQVPRTLQAWRSAQPRAPPARS